MKAQLLVCEGVLQQAGMEINDTVLFEMESELSAKQPVPAPAGEGTLLLPNPADAFDPACLGKVELPLAPLSRISCGGKNEPKEGTYFSSQIW